MKIKCTFAFTLTQDSKNGFGVARYLTDYPVVLPNGKETRNITVKGFHLPITKRILYELDGDFELFKKNDKVNYTLKMNSFKEVIPTEAESIKNYLETVDGVGKKLAEKLLSAFGSDVFEIIEKDPEKLCEVKGISKKKALRIKTSFKIRTSAKELFDYLGSLNIPTNKIIKVSEAIGPNALNEIKTNPFVLMDIAGIGFKTVDSIARCQKLSLHSPQRIKAGIMEVLNESENGGWVFNKKVPYPNFMLNAFLSQKLCDLLYQDSTFTTGGMCLSRDILYIFTLKLLQEPISETEFDSYLCALVGENRIFVSYQRSENTISVYKRSSAIDEYTSAKLIAKLIKQKMPKLKDLDQIIAYKQKELGILLSFEQREAVYKALNSPISIITGGPGTGKTSILKVIIAVFQHYYPQSDVLLASPTGKAAKRISEQTGHSAHTLHKALSLYSDEEGNSVEADHSPFRERLIIVDETSMMGAKLFSTLLSRVPFGARLILVGDTAQLPSIEIGSVLRELIDSDLIPTTELTITFRQANGSRIITNTAMIRNGAGSATYLDYGDDYMHIEKETSKEIADEITRITPKLIKKYGDKEVMVLTAYRRFTESGSNALNKRLQSILNPHKDDDVYFINSNNIKIYEGDKVMSTINSEMQANGDIGHIKTISNSEDGLIVTCEFEDGIIALEENAAYSLDLAYAMTVHKSQGAEAKCIIMAIDIAHKTLLKRNLLYTGITRGKELVITVGQTEGIEYAMKTEDSNYRLSNLSRLITKFQKDDENANSSEEQLKMSLM